MTCAHGGLLLFCGICLSMVEIVKLGNGGLAIYRTTAPAVLILSVDEARALELAIGEVLRWQAD